MLKLHKAKTYVSSLVDLIFCFAGTLCIGTGILYLIVGKIELATTGLGSGLLLLFAATIDRFESLKGLGLEAKTRELKETITEANETLIQLRKLAEISGKTLSSLVAKVGRGGTAFTVTESHEFAQEIRKNMTDMKSDESSIDRALQPWVQGLCRELALRLVIDFNNDYDSLGRTLSNRIQNMSTHDPDREALIQLHEAINTYSLLSYAHEKWQTTDILTDLRNHVTSAPAAGEDLKAKHLALIDSWAEEVDHLLKFSDLKSLQRWAEKIAS
ncbi:hypothetical protein [Pseudomonas laurylsulfatiphila]|uniref:hypothetical protein n=1 Tax=Pseudomonas laurylsulfatiphila TaxID=2011015 RepID=UPI002160ED63|nr:hypothetical protein [Pseudomonas laurylsulfatiphila]UVM06430.1 hypothetical protein LOY25_06935 [Pseudomonas laurylsulfatiphila]